MVRPAFTLIELIFSIVVISIIVGFYPMLSTEVNKSYSHAVEQNALYATTTRVQKIMTAYWDENSYEYNATNFTFSPALLVNTNQGNNSLNKLGLTQYRVGSFEAATSIRRFFNNIETNATTKANFGFDLDDNETNGAGTNEHDDIDDFDTNNAFVSIYATNNASGAYSYKEDIWMQIAVDYVSDTPIGGTDYNSSTIRYNFPTTAATAANSPTNIKMATISTRRFIPGEGNQTIFTMRIYSSNIGELQIYHSQVLP